MLHTIILVLVMFVSVFSYDVDPARYLYDGIADICHPSDEELLNLQYALLNTYRPILERMPQTGYIPREFKFIGNGPEEIPISGQLSLRCSATDRENCIILYSSFNQNYPEGIKRLLACLAQSDFKGQVHYKIGGWPNIAGGDLALVHVPFAFKACFFKEMQKEGYQRVLWLDASVLPSPHISLNFIFDIINRIGFFIQANDHTIGRFMNEDAAAAFGLTLEETQNITSCSAAIIGINFKNPVAVSLLDAWYEAAHHPYAFFSDRSDQNALSILLHQKNLSADLIPRKLLGSLSYSAGSFFIMDRSLVKTN